MKSADAERNRLRVLVRDLEAGADKYRREAAEAADRRAAGGKEKNGAQAQIDKYMQQVTPYTLTHHDALHVTPCTLTHHDTLHVTPYTLTHHDTLHVTPYTLTPYI